MLDIGGPVRPQRHFHIGGLYLWGGIALLLVGAEIAVGWYLYKQLHPPQQAAPEQQAPLTNTQKKELLKSDEPLPVVPLSVKKELLQTPTTSAASKPPPLSNDEKRNLLR